MTPEAKKGLAIGRKVALQNQKATRRGHAGKDGRTAGLRGRAAKLVEARIQKFIEAYDEEPQFLTASVVGTMLADLSDANRFLRKAWDYVHDRMKDGCDPKELLRVVEELRRWSKLTTETALRVAEISRRGGPGEPDEYLRGRYGVQSPAVSQGEGKPGGPLGLVPVTVVGAASGGPAGGNPWDPALETEPRGDANVGDDTGDDTGDALGESQEPEVGADEPA